MTPTLENIWQEFAVKLGQFIRVRVADAATAEDILQDVFVKIQARLDTLENPAKLPGWLYLITRNAIIDYYRTRKETTEVPDSLPAEPPEEDTAMVGLNAVFRRMIHRLPKPYRDALVLTEFEGLTQKELAKRLDISHSGAKSRVQRAREQLKEMLHECCTYQFDGRKRVMGCQPRAKGCCQECD